MNVDALLRTIFFTPAPHGWGLPVLFTGDPGTAKSAIIETTSAAAGLHCETVIASLREPSDFLGLPWVSQGKLTALAPAWAQRLNASEGGVLFYDELNTAPASVQKALLRTINERWVGELRLDSRVRIIAAQNPAEIAADGNDLAMPLANRFIHVPWPTPDQGEWIAHILSGDGGRDDSAIDARKARAVEAKVMQSWPGQLARAKGLVTGFIARRGELLRRTPKPEHPDASRAWPSMRTWELAIRALAGGAVHGLGDVETHTLLAGCVGAGPISEFLEYCQQADLPDFEALLDGREKWEADERLDRTLAVYQGCAALVCPTAAPRRDERAEALWTLLGRSVDTQADLVFPAARALCVARLAKSQTATQVLYKMEPISRAAGILT